MGDAHDDRGGSEYHRGPRGSAEGCPLVDVLAWHTSSLVVVWQSGNLAWQSDLISGVSLR